MSDNRIKPIVMPKWGLSMKEGKVTGWLAEEGTRIDVGKEILEVETDKIAGVVEAADSGVLRRRVGTPDTVYPVKAQRFTLAKLMDGVIAPELLMPPVPVSWNIPLESVIVPALLT